MPTKLTWNLDTRLVSATTYTRTPAQVAATRGESDVQVNVVQGAPIAQLLLDAGQNVGIVIRDPLNLKAGVLAGPTVLARGADAPSGYTGATSTDTTYTRGLMHVDPTDPATESTTYGACAVLFYVPAGGGDPVESLPFPWTVQANYYRPLQPPADLAVNYPPAAALATAIAQAAAATAALANLSGATVHTFLGDADKLEGLFDISNSAVVLKPGDYAIIASEGYRVEQFLPVAPASLTDPNYGVYTYQVGGYWTSADFANGNGGRTVGSDGNGGFVVEDVASSQTLYTSTPGADPTAVTWSVVPGFGALPLPAFTALPLWVIQANWVVLQPTIYLLVTNVGSDAVINGVSVPADGGFYSVGWCDPRAISYATTSSDDICVGQLFVGPGYGSNYTVSSGYYLFGTGAFGLPGAQARATYSLVISD